MSVIFYLIALLLTALAVGIIAWSILRAPNTIRSNRHAKNVEVAKQRLNELQQRQNAGEISPADATQYRDEIERDLIADVGGLEGPNEVPAAGEQTGSLRWAVIAIAALIPTGAGLLYLAVGEPGGVSISPASKVASVESPPTGVQTGDESQSFEQLTKRLLSHLAVNPEDALGWNTLAQLFIAQQRFAEAAGAYRKVRELEGDSADLLVREADALAMANDGVLEGHPETLIEQALGMEPQHTSALWLAGLAAGGRGDIRTALDFWKQAEKTTNNEQMLGEIRRLIDSANQELARIDEAGPTPENSAASAAIQVKATIAPTILEQLDADDTVYLFARALNGPPMPLAVLKKQVKDLPTTVQLDDSMAMLPNLKISSFEEVFIVARVSFSGAPQAQSGDYFGRSPAVRPGTDQDIVAVTISERVP